MPQGLQIFDAQGNLIMDVTDRLSRVLGVVTTNAVAGSLVNADLTSGTPYHINSNADGTVVNQQDAECVVTFSDTTMSWTYGAGTARDTEIIYGVY